MNIKKMFTTLSAMVVAVTMTMPSVSVLAATPDTELGAAYEWAYSKGVTTMDSYEKANMGANITRAEMAKMLSVYATEVLGYEADTSKACTFTDIDSVKGDLHDYIIESCQLGLMGQGITAFRPYDTISRAEFGTALSRTLWGDTYEGGTPYYAKHLQALQSAGIMKQIANAESTKEVRGYVMIMLQRSEENASPVDCSDTDVVLVCMEDLDKCPAACKAEYEEDNGEDEVVKSGDLAVTADSSDEAKVFIGRPSDLDILTFKTSEEVEISKIVLERYGYSTPTNVAYVWLENEEGTIITNKAKMDSKGQAKLTLKKNYKKVDGELNATVVLETSAGANNPYAGLTVTNPGATFGFKVVDVTSTAKNLNLDNYKPATYEAIAYNGSLLTIVSRNYNAKTYNFEAGNMYEVLKFKLHTPDDAAIVVKGFTLKNQETTQPLDLDKYFDEAEVSIAGEKVSKLNAEANKDGELVFSFDDVEVAAKTKAEVVVKISLADDFNSFNANNVAKLELTDINAVDAKVSARVRTAYNPAWLFTSYTFKGGKIKLTNTKLGNIDAAQNAEDVVIAEGTISVPETVKGTFYIDVKGAAAGAVKDLTFVVNGDETDGTAYDLTTSTTWSATPTYPAGSIVNDGAGKYYIAKRDVAAAVVVTTTTDWEEITIPAVAANSTVDISAQLKNTDFVRYTFDNVEIEKSGKVRFLVDIRDNPSWNSKSMSLSSFGFSAFTTMKYDEANQNVQDTEVSGTISFSKVTVQPSKASLKNNVTKEVEFANKATNREVVFDGTYTSKRGDIKLNEFSLESATALASAYPATKVTFYLIVDGDEVADAQAVWNGTTSKYEAENTFDNVLVANGESVSVKVEAEVEANEAGGLPLTLGKYKLTIQGEDENGNTESGQGSANTVNMKVVDKGSVNVSTSATKQTILKKASDAIIAQFIVKPANGASSVDLEEISFTLDNGLTKNDITLTVDDIEEDDVTGLTYVMNRNITSDGATVKITLDDEFIGTVTLDNLQVNGKLVSKTFTKKYVEAAVEIIEQKVSNGSTIFTLAVDADSDVDVRNFKMYSGAAADPANKVAELLKVFEDGDTVYAENVKDLTQPITKVTYEYSSTAVAGDVTAGVYTITFAGTTWTTADTVTVDGVVLSGAAATADTDAAAAKFKALIDADATLSAKYSTAVAGSVVTLTQKAGKETAVAPVATTNSALGTVAVATTTAGLAAGETKWNLESITIAALPDYFKIGDEPIKVMNL